MRRLRGREAALAVALGVLVATGGIVAGVALSGGPGPARPVQVIAPSGVSDTTTTAAPDTTTTSTTVAAQVPVAPATTVAPTTTVAPIRAPAPTTTTTVLGEQPTTVNLTCDPPVQTSGETNVTCTATLVPAVSVDCGDGGMYNQDGTPFPKIGTNTYRQTYGGWPSNTSHDMRAIWLGSNACHTATSNTVTVPPSS